ncbi:MAG: thymidylate kinase [Candidatus Nitrosomirales archaeon]|jgi:thymidylate kinase
MGNDGSGKTTISNEVAKFFKDLGFDTSYKHEYEYAVIKFIFKLVGKKIMDKSRNEMLVEKKRSAKYRLWPYLVLMDLAVQFVYQKLFRKKEILLLDRYPYDHYMSFKYLGTLTKLTEWLYLHFPKPDAILILTVDPEIAYQRKKATHTYSVSFYGRQTEAYVKLATQLKIRTINTSGSLNMTLKEVLTVILQNKTIYQEVMRRGSQSRLIFDVLKRYDLLDTPLFSSLQTSYLKRKAMYDRSIYALKEILKVNNISHYAVIKTIDDYDFIGNDIDVLVSPADFEIIRSYCSKHLGNNGIAAIRFNVEKEEGKADIAIEGGLKLDLHSHIGWDNMRFFEFDELSKDIHPDTIFGADCYSLSNEVNAFIISAHVFEKGYLTLDEYLFLKQHFDFDSFREHFPELSRVLASYLKGLLIALESQPPRFPHFVPLSTIFKGHFGLMRRNGNLTKSRKQLRDLLLTVFWNLRFHTTRKLPFAIELLDKE